MSYHNHKEYKCLVCGKDFKKPRQLKQHLLSHFSYTHTDKCDGCGKQYLFLNEVNTPVCINTKCKLFGIYSVI
ncbi:MAG: hypothetical protein DRO67_02000 [Candidatus Asgardarchaeum californiense]|nr:MAG: hypothetical protein DRO67_02000 [Candidatus Asgardarchaeum californiense]